MRNQIKEFIKGFYYSFPIQLLLLHFKSNHLLLLFWLVLTGMVGDGLAKTYGARFLFLAPEYLGAVSWLSFFFTGLGFSGFFMAWNLSTYIIHSHRFPFLASLKRPFTKFTLNNAIIPLSFFIFYIIKLSDFQWYSQIEKSENILAHIGGLVLGTLSGIFIAFLYLNLTNKDGLFFIEKPTRKVSRFFRGLFLVKRLEDQVGYDVHVQALQVQTYLSEGLRTRPVRDVRHYEYEILASVFRQNHVNALVFQVFGISLLVAMGLLMDFPYFNIPASASIFTFFGVTTAILGAFTYWLRDWLITSIVVFIVLMNYLMSYDSLYMENHAFGMNYQTERPAYTYEKLDSLASWENFTADYDSTEYILNQWRAQFPNTLIGRKPKLVIVCSSGGGMRATLWAMTVLQQADSLTNGNLMKHTALMTGASGGMLGAAYYRELYLQKRRGKPINLAERQWSENLTKDLLNRITFTFVVNDMFIPVGKFKEGDYTYHKDRGYAFEEQFISNTGGLLKKSLKDYREDERKAIIPLMFLTPVIINDGRQLVISPQRVSYMMRPLTSYITRTHYEVDAVDFGRFFANNDPYNLRFASAIRMNATYPYVMPNVYMPSTPAVQVMDAGLRDNYGLQSACRFVHVFKAWMMENTSGIILLQIRDSAKIGPVKYPRRNFIGKVINPLGTVADVGKYQDYHLDSYYDYLRTILGPNMIQMIHFEYEEEEEKRRASVSFHLTEREKRAVRAAIHRDNNKAALLQLQTLLR